MRSFLILLGLVYGVVGYYSPGKDHLLSGGLFRELVNRMGKDFIEPSYLDFPDSRIPMGSRSLTKELEEEELFPLDYDALDETNLHPSLRDQEFLEHSSLWSNQLVSGGAGEGQQKLKPQGVMNKPEMKADTTLPAYCNPPNPCPVGYTAEMNCLEEFENTAAFSRKYQAAQDCMCDTEHMFYCPDLAGDSGSDEIVDGFDDLDFNRFLQRTLQVDPMFGHKSLVAKKFHPDKPIGNPFLTGEKLPVAAKKGNKVLY